MAPGINEEFDHGLFELVVGRTENQLLNDAQIHNFFNKQQILIIGAGGSIGSAIARRLVPVISNQVFMLDRDESALHGLSLELTSTSASHSDRCFVADIRDRQSLQEVIELIRPSMVIHAAALKHLVMLERFPREGYLTNIIGTLNVAQLCVENGVKHFVNISTDKAANPISVLGKTKKLAELISEEVFIDSGFIQCSVRFGNVFASRGSVIETFIHQIKNGIPVTVTDLNVARYFMSHQEAANLVLSAASINESGTYIQDMGNEILITDIVQRIAKFFNKTPVINFTGLKSGEKIKEELHDGPVHKTKFESISRSLHPTSRGLVQEILTSLPKNNSEAVVQIKKLTTKYLKSF